MSPSQASKRPRAPLKRTLKKRTYVGLYEKKPAPKCPRSPNVIVRASQDGLVLRDYCLRRDELANHLPLLSGIFREKECNGNYDVYNKVIRFVYPRGMSTSDVEYASLDRIFFVEGFLQCCEKKQEHNYQDIKHLNMEEFWRFIRLVMMAIKMRAVVEGRRANDLQMAIEVATWMGASATCLDVLNQALRKVRALDLSIKMRVLEKERQVERELPEVPRPLSVRANQVLPSDLPQRLFIIYSLGRNATKYEIEVLLEADQVLPNSTTLSLITEHKITSSNFDPDHKVLRFFPIFACPGMFNAIINMNNLIKVSRLPPPSKKWFVSYIDNLADDDISSGLSAFLRYIAENSYIEKHSCTNLTYCLEHLPKWIAVGKWMGASSFLAALDKKLHNVINELKKPERLEQSGIC